MNERDDKIAMLIRMAGPRTRASDERTARVRENVRDEWLRATQRRGRVRMMMTIAATIVLAIVGSAIVFRKNEEPRGQLIATTTQPQSLDWNGVAIRLDRQTQLRIVSNELLVLDRGALYFDGHDAHREVRTPFGAIRDIGTQYEARVDDALRIRVREGRVTFRGNRVDAGSELVMRNGEFERRAIARSGDAWSWIESAAPPIRLEGMRLRDVLAHVAHEKGLALGDVPNGDVRLHGDVPLSPSEALDAATAAAGVAYEIRDDRLIVTKR